jgi:3-isopropylmalate/(R)-2-methylmalate dehydratase small subunit
LASNDELKQQQRRQWSGNAANWDSQHDPFLKHCLLNGLDNISLTLQSEADISKFEESRPGFLPRAVV